MNDLNLGYIIEFIIVLYGITILWVILCTRKKFVLWAYDYWKRIYGSGFVGWYGYDIKLREKRKKQGKFLLILFWILALLLVYELFTFPMNWSDIHKVCFVATAFIVVSLYQIGAFFYVRAVEDEIIKEIIGETKNQRVQGNDRKGGEILEY